MIDEVSPLLDAEGMDLIFGSRFSKASSVTFHVERRVFIKLTSFQELISAQYPDEGLDSLVGPPLVDWLFGDVSAHLVELVEEASLCQILDRFVGLPSEDLLLKLLQQVHQFALELFIGFQIPSEPIHVKSRLFYHHASNELAIKRTLCPRRPHFHFIFAILFPLAKNINVHPLRILNKILNKSERESKIAAIALHPLLRSFLNLLRKLFLAHGILDTLQPSYFSLSFLFLLFDIPFKSLFELMILSVIDSKLLESFNVFFHPLYHMRVSY